MSGARTSHQGTADSRDLAVPTRELIIYNFAGGGGASTSIELALGVSPDFQTLAADLTERPVIGAGIFHSFWAELRFRVRGAGERSDII